MKLTKKQLIECLNYVQNRPDSERAGEAFNLELPLCFIEATQDTENDMFEDDKNIINFVANFCMEEAKQYFYSTHSQDLFKL